MGIGVQYFSEFREQFEIEPGRILVKTFKDDPVIPVPSAHVADYPYIILNRGDIHFVHVDVDMPRRSPAFGETEAHSVQFEAFDTAQFEALNVPLPALSVLSRRSVHHFWQLATPLPADPTRLAIRYYLDVRRNLIRALGGDIACQAIGVGAKNPFFAGNLAVRYPSKACELNSLRVLNSAENRDGAVGKAEYEYGNRNVATFKAALRYFGSCRGATSEDLLVYIEHFQSLHEAEPLGRAENQNIVGSILKSSKYYSFRAERNYGAMGLITLKGSGLPPEQMLAKIRARQSDGAKFSGAQRTEKAKEAIKQAILSLAAGGQKLTGEKIAAHGGVSLRVVWKFIKLKNGVETWND